MHSGLYNAEETLQVVSVAIVFLLDQYIGRSPQLGSSILNFVESSSKQLPCLASIVLSPHPAGPVC